ncbi:hypothetical protein IE4872_PD02240 (plasmid) [Rhizobium gallicum]|uniref:Uncharacterized protein n=1 Tax=Rhizobium gallicum TaxID=56730 RepID=A0A1L5NY04_9HYPH|nr:hypothetical protein IE4872_PD02240 [Rhizobium gallicum]
MSVRSVNPWDGLFSAISPHLPSLELDRGEQNALAEARSVARACRLRDANAETKDSLDAAASSQPMVTLHHRTLFSFLI